MLLASVSLAPSQAHADLRLQGPWTLYGLSVARNGDTGDNNFAVGIELSDVMLFENRLWFGYYGDLRYSQAARGIDLSIGVEAGYAFFGIDAGVYARIGERSAVGFRARGCFSAMAVVSICAGGGYTNRGGFIEAGILLKYGRIRSDSQTDTEAGDEDDAAPPEVEVSVGDESVFVEDAEFDEGLHSEEPEGETEDAPGSQEVGATGGLDSVEVEPAPEVLPSDAGADPDLVEATDLEGQEER